MKNFEKWERNFYANHQGNFHFDPTCKMGWKAALECVQNIACKGGILQDDFVIRKWIRKELEE